MADRIHIRDDEPNILDIIEAWNSGEPLEARPETDIYPLMEGDELRELGEDIEDNGLQKPIVFYRGKVLDGRCRLLAMGSKRPTIDPSRCGIPHSDVTTYIEWLPDDTDPIAYVVSANTHRRHLNKRILAEQIVAHWKKKLAQREPVSHKGGRGKRNRLRQAAVEEGAQHDISESTMKRALAEKKPSRKKATVLDTIEPGLIPARQHYLSECEKPGVDLEIELEIITDAIHEIARLSPSRS